jgi:hypothetical protein
LAVTRNSVSVVADWSDPASPPVPVPVASKIAVSLVVAGGPAGFQLAAVAQAVEVVPSQ